MNDIIVNFPSQKFLQGLTTNRYFQLDFINNVFNTKKYRYMMLKWARQHGKSTMCLNLLVKSCLENPNRRYAFIFITTVAAKNILTKEPEMMAMLPEQKGVHGPIWDLNMSEMTIKFYNGSILQLYGADDPHKLRGLRAYGFCIDEWATHNSDIVYKQVIEPVITNNPEAWCIFIYTPVGVTHASEMWDKASKGEYGDDWYCSKLTAEDSHLLPYETLMEAKNRVGELYYRQEYLCEDNADDAAVIIKQQLISNLENVKRTQKYLKRVIAVDPALEGGDECVCFYMENSKVISTEVISSRDTTVITAQILMFSEKKKCKNIVVDSCGLGKGIYDSLNKTVKNIIDFNAGCGAKDKKRFKNLKSEAWFHCRLMMEQGKIPPLIDPELKRQLSAVRYKYGDSNRKIVCEPKLETKKRLGRSCDRADAFIMGVWAYDKLPDENRYKIISNIDRERIEGNGNYSYMSM